MSNLPKRPPTAQEFVLNQLRQEIITRELSPGAPIRQELLAEKYGTSRVPLREALKILEGEGQVTYIPHRGYFVAELSLDDLHEVYVIREMLESKALEAASTAVTLADVEYLASLLDQVEAASAAGDVTGMANLNRQFHFAIFELSSMPRLVRLIRVLWDATDAYRSMYYAEETNRLHVNREHREMLAALTDKDSDSLIKLHSAHRNRAVETLSLLLGD